MENYLYPWEIEEREKQIEAEKLRLIHVAIVKERAKEYWKTHTPPPFDVDIEIKEKMNKKYFSKDI